MREDLGDEVKELRKRGEEGNIVTAEITPEEVVKQDGQEREKEKGIKYVVSQRSGLTHLAPTGGEDGDAFNWRTACTWQYARYGRYKEIELSQAKVWRKRCLEADSIP